MRKIIAIIIGCICILPAASCQENTSCPVANDYMHKLDSLLETYTTKPVYYARYGNNGCLFDLRINDVYTAKTVYPGRIGSTVTPINTEILKSGKNKVSLRLYPNPGDSLITEAKPFHLRIQYKDFSLPAGSRPWNIVLEMPPIAVSQEGLPYYEYEAEFEAQVPYQITGWSDCIDLREVPDIEQKVVAEFKRIRGLMVYGKFDQLEDLLAYKNFDIGVPLYKSSEDKNKSWEKYVADIQEGNSDQWQPIEDYELVFYAHGRLVTLESKKKKGFPSALVWIKDDEDSYEAVYFDMRLGIRKGTNEFIPIR